MRDNDYIRRARIISEEADILLQSVKRSLYCDELPQFPLYLYDLKELIDNLCYLNVANNAVNNHIHNTNNLPLLSKKKVVKKKAVKKKSKK